MITDFELAVINAVVEVFGNIIRACFFHLRQAVHLHIQSEGLQTAYNDENDDSIRNAAHMLCAIAFVPMEFVNRAFDVVVRAVPRRFLVITEYFKVNNSNNCNSPFFNPKFVNLFLIINKMFIKFFMIL